MKVILVTAARPNFMKIAPIMRAISKHNHNFPEFTIQPLLVHTGQHYDYEMSQIFFQDLELPQPDIHLGIGSGTHAEQTGKVMIEFEKVLLKETPDMVIVVGDVNSTLAAALAAVKLHIPVAHVEAGIRTNDISMPEEVNRRLTDHISRLLFTTSENDDDNLKKEGIQENLIYRVGNIMVDSLLYCKETSKGYNTLNKLGLTSNSYVLLTLHRPVNVDNKDNLSGIIDAVNKIAEKIPVIFPAHPRTQKRLHEFQILNSGNAIISGESQSSKPGLLIIPPQGYLDFLNLEMNARFVISDSGGIQVETTVLGIPCLTILDIPIWKITHEQGINILVGRNRDKLITEAFNILSNQIRVGNHKIPDYWDGKTAERIVEIISHTSQS